MSSNAPNMKRGGPRGGGGRGRGRGGGRRYGRGRSNKRTNERTSSDPTTVVSSVDTSTMNGASLAPITMPGMRDEVSDGLLLGSQDTFGVERFFIILMSRTWISRLNDRGISSSSRRS